MLPTLAGDFQAELLPNCDSVISPNVENSLHLHYFDLFVFHFFTTRLQLLGKSLDALFVWMLLHVFFPLHYLVKSSSVFWVEWCVFFSATAQGHWNFEVVVSSHASQSRYVSHETVCSWRFRGKCATQTGSDKGSLSCVLFCPAQAPANKNIRLKMKKKKKKKVVY